MIQISFIGGSSAVPEGGSIEGQPAQRRPFLAQCSSLSSTQTRKIRTIHMEIVKREALSTTAPAISHETWNSFE